MQNKFYTISWVSPPSKDPDPHGNYWYNMKFEGYEYNVTILAKNPPQKDQRVYGYVEKVDKKSKPGEHYFRFRKQQVPDDVKDTGATPQLEDDDRIGDILQMVKEIHKVVGAVSEKTEEESLDQQAREVEELMDSDEPVDLSTLPF